MANNELETLQNKEAAIYHDDLLAHSSGDSVDTKQQ
jgi:hypothetical protein